MGIFKAAVFFCSFIAHLSTAEAKIEAVVDKSEQKMYVSQNGKHLYTWDVSTGKKLSWTHNGTFGIQSLRRMWYSKKYHHSPMPYSIFYDGDRAIHGTDSIKKLGRQASMGCVRLHPENAGILFGMVLKDRNLVIVIKN